MSRKTIHAVALGALVGASVPALAAHDGWNDQGDVRGHRQEQVVIAPQRSPTRVMVDRPLHMNRPVYTARPLSPKPLTTIGLSTARHPLCIPPCPRIEFIVSPMYWEQASVQQSAQYSAPKSDPGIRELRQLPLERP